MQISFSDPDLARLYEGRKPKRKVWKSNPQLVKQFIKTVNQMRTVTRVEQLMQFSGLHYKKLTDIPEGISAVRINKQYRLHFKEIENDEDPPRVVLFQIEEITDHYEKR